MGLFSSAVKAIANPLSITNPSSSAVKDIANPLSITNLSSIGSIYNDITGATSAAKQAQKYNLQNMKVTNQYQKEFAQNAHQWEAQDLQKAGYNPALTTGLSGASAGGAGGGAGAGAVTNGSPIDAVSAIGNLINNTSATKADNELKKLQGYAETINANANYLNALTNADVGTSTIGMNTETTKRTKGGLPATLLGTDEKEPLKKALLSLFGGFSAIGGAGLAIKGAQWFKKAKQTYAFSRNIKKWSGK